MLFSLWDKNIDLQPDGETVTYAVNCADTVLPIGAGLRQAY